MIRKNNTHFPPKSRLQIAEEYGIDYKTLVRRLKKHNVILPSGLVYPREQKDIYLILGYPSLAVENLFKGH